MEKPKKRSLEQTLFDAYFLESMETCTTAQELDLLRDASMKGCEEMSHRLLEVLKPFAEIRESRNMNATILTATPAIATFLLFLKVMTNEDDIPRRHFSTSAHLILKLFIKVAQQAQLRRLIEGLADSSRESYEGVLKQRELSH